VRVGAGGIWGGFGWLWTKRQGLVQMYISRTEGFVWIERAGARPWLLTPEQPEEFVRALSRGEREGSWTSTPTELFRPMDFSQKFGNNSFTCFLQIPDNRRPARSRLTS
jgi:hypothetical protein